MESTMSLQHRVMQPTRSRHPFGGIGLVCIAALLLPYTARAVEAELQVIANDTAVIGVRLKTLLNDYGENTFEESRRRFEDRFTNAETLYLLRDYQRASILLLDLIDRRDAKSKATYPQALYYLADSQFQMKNYLGAREYFRSLVELREDKFLTEAIKRLIEIGDHLHNWEGLDAYVALLRDQGRVPAIVAYSHAKSLLRQKLFERVEAVVRDIAETNKLYPKARYLVAVAKLQMDDFDGARQIFDGLTTTGIREHHDDGAMIRDLAAMNRGRILLEQGQLVEAADAYQFIQRSSPLFDEALYEITWLYVRAARQADSEKGRENEYKRALKSLEILLLSETETTLAPEARLLLGNIQLRLGDFQGSTKSFDQVVNRYAPVRDELKKLAEDVDDPVAYYDDIVQRRRGGGGLLPPLAVKWAAQQDRLKEALGVVADIDQSESWIVETQRLIDDLLEAMSKENRAKFFPALQKAEVRGLSIENALTELTERLLDIERDLVRPDLDGPSASKLDTVIAERRRLEPLYQALPKDEGDYADQASQLRKQLGERQSDAFRLRWRVEEMRRGLSALNTWIAENVDAVEQAQKVAFRERLALAEKEIDELDQLQSELTLEIERDMNLIGSNAQDSRMQDIRNRYVATLEEERAILDSARSSASPERRRSLEEVSKQRSTLLEYYNNLRSFQDRLTQVASEKASQIKNQLVIEQRTLQRHMGSIDHTRGEAKRVIGEIAISSLKNVEGTFRSIVLRGDVGIVDVAWALKEEDTQEISRRVNQQRQELELLDSELKEILIED
ncbi:MAG: tetratricopeptide repeat protein [Myxococcota bacterium]